MMFGNALMIQNGWRYTESSIIEEVTGFKFVDAFLNQYMLALGEFDLENFRLKSEDPVVWALFFVSTFVA